MNHYINPVNFNQVSLPAGGRLSPARDFGAFTGLGMRDAGKALRGMGAGGRSGAMYSSRMLGGIGRMSQPLSRTFNVMGRNVTYGRAGMTAGLGLLAMRNGANMMDRMRYGDYGGAMMSGALTAAAGYGAYSSWMYKGALRSHFNNAASWLLKRFK